MSGATSAVVALVVAVAAVAAGGCGEPATQFQCADDAACVSPSGARGRCQPSRDCSFADDSCASGWRYAAYATPGLADGCVGDTPTDDAAGGDAADAAATDAGSDAAGAPADLAGADLAGADLAQACGGLLQPCCAGQSCGGTLLCLSGLCNTL